MVNYVNDTFQTCSVVPTAKHVEFACKFGTTTALQILASGLHIMARCFVKLDNHSTPELEQRDQEFCIQAASAAFVGSHNLLERLEMRMQNSPMESMGRRIASFRRRVTISQRIPSYLETRKLKCKKFVEKLKKKF